MWSDNLAKDPKQAQMSRTSAPHRGHEQNRFARQEEDRKDLICEGTTYGPALFRRPTEPSLQGLTLVGASKMPAEAGNPGQTMNLRAGHETVSHMPREPRGQDAHGWGRKEGIS